MAKTQFFIGASGEMPYYIKASSGCEIYSDDRKLRIVISRVKFADDIHYNVIYYVRFGKSWEKGSDRRCVDSISRYLLELSKTPNFSKATAEINIKCQRQCPNY